MVDSHDGTKFILGATMTSASFSGIWTPSPIVRISCTEND